jgi:hypothetical protein
MKKKYSFERNSGTDVNIVAKKKKGGRLGIIPRLLCLIVAMVIWLYVMYMRRSDFEVVIEDVPIELQGEDRILDKYGLEVVDGNFTVDITIRGKKSVIDTYTKGNIKENTSGKPVSVYKGGIPTTIDWENKLLYLPWKNPPILIAFVLFLCYIAIYSSGHLLSQFSSR